MFFGRWSNFELTTLENAIGMVSTFHAVPTKWPSLELKTRPKQFLGYLQLDIAFLAYYGVCALRIRNDFIVQVPVL